MIDHDRAAARAVCASIEATTPRMMRPKGNAHVWAWLFLTPIALSLILAFAVQMLT